jgi:DNA (cytosine-5)-methyltransferase 1
MTRPVLYDLFSGAGGAGEGYHRAGFRVIGVDLKPMPRYPHEFVEADAMQVLQNLADGAEAWPGAPYPDAIHASPPCQRRSRMTNCRPGLAATYPDLVGPVHDLLARWGGPWIMENVEGAGLPGQDDLFGAHGVMLCGAMFGRALYRHRWFRGSFPLRALHHPRHLLPASRAGHWRPGTVISVEGHCSPVRLAREVMDMPWAAREELAEAIPPYFAEHLGTQVLARLETERAA